LAEVKGPVMDKLQRSDLLDKLAPGRVFLSTHEAMLALTEPRKQAALVEAE
jgi:SulP family sulfate permease